MVENILLFNKSYKKEKCFIFPVYLFVCCLTRLSLPLKETWRCFRLRIFPSNFDQRTSKWGKVERTWCIVNRDHEHVISDKIPFHFLNLSVWQILRVLRMTPRWPSSMSLCRPRKSQWMNEWTRARRESLKSRPGWPSIAILMLIARYPYLKMYMLYP